MSNTTYTTFNTHQFDSDEFRDDILQIIAEEGGEKIKCNWGGYNPNYHTQEMYDEIGKHNRGRKHTEETKKLMAKADRSYMKTEEYRKKMSESLKGIVPWNKGKSGIYSDETLKKMSESAKKRKCVHK